MYFPTTHYVGFARRAAAAILDSLLFMVIEAPFMVLAYGWEYYDFSEGAPFVHGSLDVLFTWILPAIATILFWRSKGATPGKMVVRARIVDVDTGGPPIGRSTDHSH